MKRPQTSQDQLERLRTRATQALERVAVARARLREHEKRNERTRHYRLGVVLETLLFEEPVLLGRIEKLIRLESPRVRAAFGLDEPRSWFEHPVRDDAKKVVETRRVRLGRALEQLLPGNAALIARMETLMREQSPHVRSAFGMGGDGPSWFEERASGRSRAACGFSNAEEPSFRPRMASEIDVD